MEGWGPVGTLYLVGTPIGNLEDITYRAVRVLGEVGLIAAEDTRHSGRLLKHYGIDTGLVSFHGHSPESRIEMLLRELEHRDVALITDAGTPAVSDPGASLVRAAVEHGFRVEVIPGPSAVTAAVAVSGLVDSSFIFAGYPPRRASDRREFFVRLGALGYPAVLFESPQRLFSSLRTLQETFPEVDLAVCRELTKLHEEVVRGTPTKVYQHFSETKPRGELVVVLGEASSLREVSEADHEQLARQLLAQNLSVSAAARELAKIGNIRRSDAYTVVMSVKKAIGNPLNSDH
jgi:16S rRNA (cytidine1402-2'-O)-methyltransferase